jgi:TetR/AcrR family transcriptional repressor of nem operon
VLSGRPLEYDPEKALNAAMQVFWSQGYWATSVHDLLAAMDLSKSSLYQGFGGKKKLFIRCIDRYRDRMSEAFAGLRGEAGSELSFVERILLSAAAEARQPEQLRRGCLLMNTATEFAQKDRQVAGHVAAGFEGLRSVFRAAVLRGQEAGDIAKDRDPDVLANYLLSSLGGIKTVVKGGMAEREVKEVVAVILKALA